MHLGRIPNAIISIANQINANKYLISGNGSEIIDIENNKVIYENYLSKSKVQEIIEICEKNSVFYSIYTRNAILTKSLNYNILFYLNENKKNPENKKININVINDMYKYIKEYNSEDFLKVTICDNDKIIFNGIVNKLKKIKNVDFLKVYHMSKKIITHGSQNYEIAYYYTEITNKNVNKWTAIQNLIKKINIQENEVIAIGDNINDKEMVKNAGLGIALKNGSEELQKIADKVVASNNENGVSQAIYENLE